MKPRWVKELPRLLIVAILSIAPVVFVHAADYELGGYTIQRIRAVGQYQDSQFSDTIEVWFTTPIAYPAGTKCATTSRVYIDARHYQVVAAAYLAFSKGRTVNFAISEALPVRAGACEITYLDIL